MKAYIQIILTGILLFTCIPAISQEETAEEKTFEWTDDLYWDPPKELLVGIEEIGELTANRKSLKMQRVFTLLTHGDHIYTYDEKLGKLLQFDLAGNFRKDVLPDDKKLSGYLRAIDIDDEGKILLSNQRSFIVISDNKLETYDNVHHLTSSVWNDGKIVGFNMYFNDRMEGILKETDLEGKNLGTFGKPYRTFDPEYDRPMVKIKRVGTRLFFADNYYGGFGILDLKSKEQKTFDFKIPAYQRRHLQTVASIKHSRQTNSNRFYTFPVFNDFCVLEDKVYLCSTSKGLFTVVESDLNGNISRVYRGLPSEDSGAWSFAVSKVDDELRFFFSVFAPEGDDWITKVKMYAPCDKVPTREDWKLAEGFKVEESRKKEESEEEKKRKAEMAAQRKAYDAFNKARQDAEKSETEAEKRQIYYKLIEEYPEYQFSAYALRSAVGRDPAKDIAAEVLEKLEVALPKAEKEEVVSAYKLLRMSLNSIVGNVEATQADAEELLKADINIYDYYAFIRAAPRIEDWQLLLNAMDAALEKSTPEKLKELFRGMSEKDAKTRSDYYQCEFKKEKARALTHLDRVEEALAIFERVSENTECHYTGNYVNDLDQHWAVALHKAGKTSKAIAVLTPGALFGGSDEKIETLKKIYAASSQSEVFDAYLAKKRNEMAKKIDDAQFYDYEKNPVKLSKKFGKATILTFWTPST